MVIPNLESAYGLVCSLSRLERCFSGSVLVLQPHHTAKSDVVVTGVDVPFAACPHHVTGAILISAEK
jgi:hypothetical protein